MTKISETASKTVSFNVTPWWERFQSTLVEHSVSVEAFKMWLSFFLAIMLGLLAAWFILRPILNTIKAAMVVVPVLEEGEESADKID